MSFFIPTGSGAGALSCCTAVKAVSQAAFRTEAAEGYFTWTSEVYAMSKLLMEQFEDCPVLAAVKDEEGLRACLFDSEIRIVIVLYGDICSISGIVGRLKDAGKTVIVHLDLISGLSRKGNCGELYPQHHRR